MEKKKLDQPSSSLDFDGMIKKLRKGLDGGNKGIPVKFERLRKYWPYINKSVYYLLFAGTKIGKTSLADDIFLYNVIDYCLSNPEFDCHISYASLEISKTEKAVKLLSRFLFWNKGLEFSSDELLSRSFDTLVNEEIIDQAEIEARQFFEVFNQKVSIKDEFSDLDHLIAWLFSEAKRLFPDYENNPDKYEKFYWIIFIDHIGLAGNGKKEDIDRLSKVLLQLRNKYGAIPVVIQQATFDSENKEQNNVFLAKGGNKIRPTPTIGDLGDSKYTSRDANVIMALFSPAAYYISEFDGYDIRKLGNSFRNLEILRNRDGPENVNVGLYFIGKVGTFLELPAKMGAAEYDYYNNRKFLDKNGKE